ncbi:hypothetical protein DPMN_068709 [Dreissena polymorpha]|uniref:Uncharacterized protein n=1 Tax=Dreissena polymorpha TaxID=45954 RepID=A0A9D4BUG5_DREPO|nr:hypothetical protein DPMN_068709 [Dreissena polymorpha]
MLIFLLPLDALRALGLEPRYVSQFQYDEQLLEKMIRMEGEMDKWEARMNEKLGQITRVQEQINQLTESNTGRHG